MEDEIICTQNSCDSKVTYTTNMHMYPEPKRTSYIKKSMVDFMHLLSKGAELRAWARQESDHDHLPPRESRWRMNSTLPGPSPTSSLSAGSQERVGRALPWTLTREYHKENGFPRLYPVEIHFCLVNKVTLEDVSNRMLDVSWFSATWLRRAKVPVRALKGEHGGGQGARKAIPGAWPANGRPGRMVGGGFQ